MVGVLYHQGNALLYPFFVRYVLEEEGGLSLFFGNQTRRIIYRLSKRKHPRQSKLIHQQRRHRQEILKWNLQKNIPSHLKWNLPPRIDSSWGFWVFIFCWVDSSCPFGPWPRNVLISDIPWQLLPLSSALEQIWMLICFGRKWFVPVLSRWFYHDSSSCWCIFIVVVHHHHHQKKKKKKKHCFRIHDVSSFRWILEPKALRAVALLVAFLAVSPGAVGIYSGVIVLAGQSTSGEVGRKSEHFSCFSYCLWMICWF